MLKKMLPLLLILLTLLMMCPAAPAEVNRVTDRADVLSASDEDKLEEAIAIIWETYQFDVVLLTETEIDGQTSFKYYSDEQLDRVFKAYASDYYDYGGFGYGENHDGIMLLVVPGTAPGDGGYCILNTGRGEKLFTDDVMYDMEDNFLPYLRSKNYYGGLSRFVLDVQARLEAYKPLNRAGRVLPFTLGGGAAVGLVVSLVLKGQMRTVRRKQNATSYVRDGSFQLTRAQDLYLYTTTVRHKIETQSSSGGRGGGGHGGGFTGSSGTHHTGHSGRI